MSTKTLTKASEKSAKGKTSTTTTTGTTAGTAAAEATTFAAVTATAPAETRVRNKAELQRVVLYLAMLASEHVKALRPLLDEVEAAEAELAAKKRAFTLASAPWQAERERFVVGSTKWLTEHVDDLPAGARDRLWKDDVFVATGIRLGKGTAEVTDELAAVLADLPAQDELDRIHHLASVGQPDCVRLVAELPGMTPAERKSALAEARPMVARYVDLVRLTPKLDQTKLTTMAAAGEKLVGLRLKVSAKVLIGGIECGSVDVSPSAPATVPA